MPKTFKYLLAAFLLLPLFSFSQKVENIRFEQVGKQVYIYYDLEGAGSYTIQIFCSDDDGLSWGQPLKKISGAVGQNQKAGNNKRIIWDVLSEQEKIEGNIRFKIVAAQRKTGYEIHGASTKETHTSRNSVLKPEKQVGLGYMFGQGSKGGVDFTFTGKHTEIALSFMGLKALNNIGYASYTSLGFSIEAGYRFYQIPFPFDFSLHAGYGMRIFTNKDNTDETKRFHSLVMGLTIPIYISPGFGFYFKSDYWTHTENKGIFMFSVGIIWAN